MSPLEPTEPKRFPKLLFFVAIIIVALMALGLSGLFKRTPYSKAVPPLSQESLAKLPPLFPRQFILGKNPEIVSVTTQRTETSVSISVKFKDPNNTVQALVAEYEDYAPKAFWSLEKRVTGVGDSELTLERGLQGLVIRVGSNVLEPGILVNVDYDAIIEN